MSRHAKFIDLMADMATRTIPVRAARLSACLVFSNEIIGMGYNQLKSHPFQSRFGKNSDSIYLHAETDAIKNSLKNGYSLEVIRKSTLYISRVKYDGCAKRKFIRGLAKPCPGCQRAISTFDISSVFYTLEGEGFEQL